jgi:hypothetical protein
MEPIVYVRLSAEDWLVSQDRKQWSILRGGGQALDALEAARTVFPRCLVAVLGDPCPGAECGACTFCPRASPAA